MKKYSRAQHATYIREQWYPRNRKKHIADQRSYRSRKLAFIRNYKAEHACHFCGEKNSICLDFHHANGEKEFDIGSKQARSSGIERLRVEMDKCVVVCANCHRKVHAGQLEIIGR